MQSAPAQKQILIIDDEHEMLISLKKILTRRNDLHPVLTTNADTAIQLIKDRKFDLIITDLYLEESSGQEILKTSMNYHSDVPVIMITGYGTIQDGVSAMREGAFDFIEKPFTSDQLYNTIDRALCQYNYENEHVSISSETPAPFSEIIFKSEQMHTILQTVRKIARGNITVLLTGESGSGKDLIARAIHRLSDRRCHAFVPINCGTLPEPLIESELFGHEKGAFTGAVSSKPGLLELANHGTFFFDEISEMSANLQVKLLRMFEEQKIRHVGGQESIPIDVRIVAATNRDLEAMVAQHEFRDDLFFRLNTMKITIPPLRDRPEDIMPLAHYFLTALNKNHDRTIHRFSSEAETALRQYPWPGNVRELHNIVQHAFYLCEGNVIQTSHLPFHSPQKEIVFDRQALNLPYKEAKEAILKKFEIEYLKLHLNLNNGNISRTAERCGLDRRTVHRLMRKFDL